MRYNQVKDLIEWAAHYHARMARQYSEASEQTDNQRLTMALDYLASRELKMKTGLEALLQDRGNHRDILELWFDESAEFPQPPLLEALAARSVEGSVDEVAATAEQAHRHLEALYERRASRAKIEAEEEFFTALAEGHNAEARKLITSMRELEDI